MLNFEMFTILTAERVKRINMRYRAKFCGGETHCDAA